MIYGLSRLRGFISAETPQPERCWIEMERGMGKPIAGLSDDSGPRKPEYAL
jgi:hypothetical protein